MPIYPLKNKKTPEKTAGFSLLEMLVVLAIMGLVLSLVGVRLARSVESTRFVRQSEANLDHITKFRAEALLKRKALFVVSPQTPKIVTRNIPKDAIRVLPFEKNWDVDGDIIRITPSGLCLGGKLDITGPAGRKAQYELVPPLCTMKRNTPS